MSDVSHYMHEHRERFEPGPWEPPPGHTGLVFGPDDVTSMGPNAAIFAKKAALYGSRSFFLTPFVAQRINIGGEPDSTGRPPEAESWDSAFYDFLEPLLPFVEDGCVCVLPEWKLTGANWEGLTAYTKYHSVLAVGLTKHYLLEQLTEDAGAMRVMLPHLSGVPSERIIEVRHQHEGALEDFHRALSHMTTDSLDDENDLFEWMKETDENVRRLNATMESVAKKRRLEGFAAAVTPFRLS